MPTARQRAAQRIAAVCGLAVFACAAAACGEPDLTPQPVDEERARQLVTDQDVSLSDYFDYVGGWRYPVAFVGTPSYYVRFDGPAAAFDTFTAADGFADAGCTSPAISDNYGLVHAGLDCTDVHAARIVRSRPASDEAPMQLGETAVIVLSTRSRTQLYALDAGT